MRTEYERLRGVRVEESGLHLHPRPPTALAASPDGIVLRTAGELSALEIVGADVAGDLDALGDALEITGKNGNAGLVGLLDRGSHRQPVAGIEDDGLGALDNVAVDMFGLELAVTVGIVNDDVEAVQVSFLGDAVSDDLEEGVGQRHRRVSDDALFFRLAALVRSSSTTETERRDQSKEEAGSDDFHASILLDGRARAHSRLVFLRSVSAREARRASGPV